MELLQTIALLCQVASGSINHDTIAKEQLWCQQALLHCTSVKRIKMPLNTALEDCLMEKK